MNYIFPLKQTFKQKVIVIGLDGSTFELIMPWIKANKLPTLAKMIKNGVYGNLKSTIPPQSATAWMSAVTGKNPGKHGIFDFFTIENYKRKRIIGRRRCKSIWNILNENNKKVGVINVPITFPAEKVDGFMISGMLTPSFDSDFTYPKEMKKELLDVAKRYEVGIRWLKVTKEKPKMFLKKLYEVTEQLEKTTLHLMKNKKWDFFLVVFQGPDMIQHFFWKYIDPTHPLYDPRESKKFGNSILEYYQKLDAIIGKIINETKENDYVILMSDHGHGPIYKEVYLNNFLRYIELIKFKSGITASVRFLISKLGISYENIINLLNKFGLLRFTQHISDNVLMKIKQHVPEKHGMLSDIDWSKTKAYCMSFTEWGIRINLKGRERNGIVKPGKEYENLRNYIINKLYDLKDPETGEKVVEKIYKREEVYSGKQVSSASDLIIQLKDGYLLQEEFGENIITRVKQSAKTSRRSADHNMNGILIMKGQNIKRGIIIENAEIVDIAPTILHIFGLSVPKDMDGRVLKEIFREESEPAKREIYYQELSEKEGMIVEEEEEAGYAYSPEEEEEIKKRLKSLGYL